MKELNAMRLIMLRSAALLLLLFLPLTPVTGSDTASAIDVVAVSYEGPETVLLLGLSGGNRARMTIYNGITVEQAGARALPGGMGAAETFGGRLRYTIFGYSQNYKITVESNTGNYTNDSVLVKIDTIVNGGSALGTLGTRGSEYVSISFTTSRDLLTNISGSQTWTGTGRYDGARLKYRLEADPGGVSGDVFPVLYTLTPQ